MSVETNRDAYVVDENFVPNPTDRTGTVLTSGENHNLHHLPIFSWAKREAMKLAGRALDPEDEEVPASHVVLPQGDTFTVIDPEAHKDRIREQAAQIAAEDEAAAPKNEGGGPVTGTNPAPEGTRSGAGSPAASAPPVGTAPPVNDISKPVPASEVKPAGS